MVLKTPEKQLRRQSKNIEEFLDKWTGFLGDIDPDVLKHQYFQDQHA